MVELVKIGVGPAAQVRFRIIAGKLFAGELGPGFAGGFLLVVEDRPGPDLGFNLFQGRDQGF